MALSSTPLTVHIPWVGSSGTITSAPPERHRIANGAQTQAASHLSAPFPWITHRYLRPTSSKTGRIPHPSPTCCYSREHCFSKRHSNHSLFQVRSLGIILSLSLPGPTHLSSHSHVYYFTCLSPALAHVPTSVTDTTMHRQASPSLLAEFCPLSSS